MEAVKCAVVGLGLIGTEHAAVLAGSPAADLAVCCDVDPQAKGRVPDGVPFTTVLDEALAAPGLEAVFVCTPEFAHRPTVEAALARDLHVFCEKPLAASLEDANAMIEAANRRGGGLDVGHILRFDLRYIELWRAVRSGKLGRCVHVVARRNSWDTEGKAVRGRTTLPLYLGVHDLDVLRWLAGDIARVYAEAGGAGVVGEGIHDTVAATLRFDSGAVGLLELSWGTPSQTGIEWDSRLAFIGSEGSAYVDIAETGVSVYTAQGPQFPDTTYWPRTYGAPSGILRTEDEHLLLRVRDGRPWPLTLEDARAALVAALAMDRSIAEERPVSLTELVEGDPTS